MRTRAEIAKLPATHKDLQPDPLMLRITSLHDHDVQCQKLPHKNTKEAHLCAAKNFEAETRRILVESKRRKLMEQAARNGKA